MKKTFLAGLSPAEFLRRHWQKKPLLARKALCDHAQAVTRDRLFELAARRGIESRIVTRKRGRWQVRHGPFSRAEIERMPRTGWTLLVQGVDAASRPVARLLREFAFIPHARLDDVMVSYAAEGGGVGPHFDTYDVFLVQGEGERRWRVSAQRDLDLVPDAPLKILERFRPEREWTLRPGDALYLPPGYAHEGVAESACITYSVGFRAPAAQELGASFLAFLQDRLALEGRYADPHLAPTRRPGRIPADLLRASCCTLDRLRWSQRDVAEFVGRYLSEPKDHVVFVRPARPLRSAAFARRVMKTGVELAPASRMLYCGGDVFLNGEVFRPAPAPAGALARLADARELRPPLGLGVRAQAILYEWYLAGYIAPGSRLSTSDE